jgi:hypothetical protein
VFASGEKIKASAATTAMRKKQALEFLDEIRVHRIFGLLKHPQPIRSRFLLNLGTEMDSPHRRSPTIRTSPGVMEQIETLEIPLAEELQGKKLQARPHVVLPTMCQVNLEIHLRASIR